MKKIITYLLSISLLAGVQNIIIAQVAQSTPNGTLIANQNSAAAMPSSSIFEVRSNNKGMLPPRMTTAQINAIATPEKGLMAYDTEQNCLKTYDGTQWQCANANIVASTPLSSSFAYQSVTDNQVFPKAIAGDHLGISGDNLGNTYTVGAFSGAITFGKSSNVTSLTSLGGFDGFIVKHDSNGNLVWATQISGSFDQEILDIEVDNGGFIVVTGYLKGNTTFYSTNGSSSTFSNTDNSNSKLFLARYNNAGVLQWFKTVGVSTNDARGYGVAVDANRNITFTGYYSGSVSFDSFPLSSNSGSKDIFVAKVNASGVYQWVKSSGGNLDDTGFKVVADNTNNVYVYGEYRGTANFGASPNVVTHTSRGAKDSFLLKYDENGNNLWTNTLGTIYDEALGDIAYTPVSNHVFITGSYYTTLTFGPGLGTNSLASFNTCTNCLNGFLAKYDLNGNIIWSVRQGCTSSYSNMSNGVSVDSFGKPYICGVLNYNSYFSSFNSPNNYYLKGVNYAEPFIAKYSREGALEWVIAAIDGDDETCVNIVVQNNIANIVGTFELTSNFGYQQLHTPKASNGDLFIWRYKE